MKRQIICFTPEEVFEWIEQANLQQLREVMDAVQERCALLVPDWDIVYLALPQKDPEQRQRLLKKVLEE